MSPKEKIPAPEAAPEKIKNAESTPTPEQSSESIKESKQGAPVIPSSSSKGVSKESSHPSRDELTQDIELVMEEGLGTLYASLPEEAKPLFRAKGEEAATEIANMIKTAKLKTSRVLRLLRDWLLTIPKVNKFFLEQEAKIKTDRIVELHKDHSEKPRA